MWVMDMRIHGKKVILHEFWCEDVHASGLIITSFTRGRILSLIWIGVGCDHVNNDYQDWWVLSLVQSYNDPYLQS